MKQLLKSLATGPAQIMFQPNATTGVLTLVAILWGGFSEGHAEVALGAVVGLVVATLTGRQLHLPHREAEIGLTGFNGTLVGCAIITFLGGGSLWSWVAVVLGAAMSVWIRTGLNRIGAAHKVNSLTLPFVLCTWLFLLSARALDGFDSTTLAHPMLPATFHHTLPAQPPTSLLEALIWPLRGVAQVVLVESWVSGAVLIVALAASNPWAALWAYIGSAVGTYGALLMGAPMSAVESGIYGFSPALTAIALATAFYRPSLPSALWALLGSVATIFAEASLTVALEPLGLPTLTAPYCIVTWLFLLPMFPLGSRSRTGKEPNHTSWHHHLTSPSPTTTQVNQ